jgi:hypothetical protein
MGIDSPINITNNITDTCIGGCALSFNFQDSTCVVDKLGSYSLTTNYDTTTDATKYYKTFRNEKYEVKTIRIINKSFHRYNGKRTEAELLIYFLGTGDNSSKQMIISIPIEEKPSSGAETKLNGSIITSMIMAVDSSKTDIRTASSLSDKATVKFASGATYNLNNLIPSQQPFYKYNGNQPYVDVGDKVNYIVFPRDSSIYIPTSAIERLNKITTPFESPVSGVPQNTAEYNSAGANAGELDNNVYIECSPTGSDGVQLYQAKNVTGSETGSDTTGSGGDASFTNIIESKWFIIGFFKLIYRLN